MRVLPCETPTKEPIAELAVISNFHQRRPEGLNSEAFDTKLNALTGRPRIHMEICRFKVSHEYHIPYLKGRLCFSLNSFLLILLQLVSLYTSYPYAIISLHRYNRPLLDQGNQIIGKFPNRAIVFGPAVVVHREECHSVSQ